jgi:hypothetical protein
MDSYGTDTRLRIAWLLMGAIVALVIMAGLCLIVGCGPNSVQVLDANTPIIVNLTVNVTVEPNAINIPVNVNIDAHLLKGIQDANDKGPASRIQGVSR